VVLFCLWLIYLLLPLAGAGGFGLGHPYIR
jgi:hypothetical protein